MKKEDMIQRTEDFMVQSFEEENIPAVIARGMIRHLLQTKAYVVALTKDTRRDTTALEVAALLHGIERAFRRSKKYRELEGKDHETRSALISKDFMKKNGFPPKLIRKTVGLIQKHETAPTQETKILRDADNLSFLENTLPIWFEARLWMGEDKDVIIEDCKKRVEEKFKQLRSKRAKELAKKYYKKWCSWLTQKELA